MKINPPVFVLHLYDVENTAGVTADISPMDTGTVVRGFCGTATSGGIVNINAGVIRTLCDGITKCCPKAIVNLISNPVITTASVAAKVFKRACPYDPKKLLGVTMLVLTNL
ncbi:malate dehydrogenase, glyoxysomal-like [Eucalyptus grandis]|uniref:malate dehydrogenase, glyoxysomal-like n=1 Tax=Eucalyptus grandis TaxID=71139 RepID=UPI00192F08BA|nr:malate dehydrogenase, glyoxysomal-like [Eucalyptus grandis]